MHWPMLSRVLVATKRRHANLMQKKSARGAGHERIDPIPQLLFLRRVGLGVVERLTAWLYIALASSAETSLIWLFAMRSFSTS